MVSAPDIITYIGVPLAVLGVLPIIYNTITTLTTLQKIRRILRHGRLTAITRGDVINHVIEVELPRYTITPLDRETCKDYWRLSAFPSTILGGSWTIFNWRMNTTGIKTQRIDYSDQLRQPQAEIDFEELVSYMLDLGAVPDAAGFRMLRTSGLWVPTGTPLLLSPNQQEAALTVALLDDSDGKLSLAVSWSSDWCMRDQHSLPPYWAIVQGIPPPRPRTATGEEDIELEKNLKGTQAGDNALPSEEEEEDTQKVIETLSDEVKTQSNLMAWEIISNSPPAIRCKIGLEGLTAAIPDDNDAQMFDQPDITHLDTESGNNSKGIWFASTLTALGSTSHAILWNYKIPTSILSFSRKDTIPCGILVMLEIVEESSTPEIFTQYNNSAELNEAQFRKMRERSRAFQRETRLSPAERSLAVQERQLKEHDDWVHEMNNKRRKETQRAETRMVEALQSPKWDNRLVAEHTLAWLKAHGHIDQTHDLKRVVEILLWRMINDVDFAVALGKMLDVWKAWVENGGIRKADFLLLKEAVVMFAFASLVVAVVYESVAAAHGSLAVDLQECLRIWKRVRLG